MKATNRAASIRARLLNRARAVRADFNLMLTRYSIERLDRLAPRLFVVDDSRLKALSLVG